MEAISSNEKTVTGPLTGRTLSVKDGKVAPVKDAAKGAKPAANPPKKADKVPAKAAEKTPAPKPEKSAPAKGSGKKIKILAKDNPHRKSSKDHKKFQKLKTGMTTTEAHEAGVDQGYLNYAVKREIISIG